ncbi:lipoprotein 17-related variable surface protein [Mycoplasmopsis caviae]|uniref:Lipoprotein 17-related variable surface protein n=1 Tax=Mycoplasmopsis caviae TaxID=55603 RepID=A0A3P8LB62_9BACT|nr:lipoprotein 17-related variable surface protein [Mycoplasmopsis caviae]UUD34930.1 lipoprotein 17-related variable surface protein [Mycoplasmopsis caviae]VDR42241.1 Uncharacterised protein [Mycoplasmopsis caviae]
MKKNKKILLSLGSMSTFTLLTSALISSSCGQEKKNEPSHSINLDNELSNVEIKIKNIDADKYGNHLPSSISKDKIIIDVKNNKISATVKELSSDDQSGELIIKFELKEINNPTNVKEFSKKITGFKKKVLNPQVQSELSNEHFSSLESALGLDKDIFASMNESKIKSNSNAGDFIITQATLIRSDDKEGNIEFEVSGSYKGTAFKKTKIKSSNYFKMFTSAKSLSAKVDKNKLFKDKKKISEIKNLTNEQLKPYISEYKLWTQDNNEIKVDKFLNAGASISGLSLNHKSSDNYTITLSLKYNYKENGQIKEKTVTTVSSEIELKDGDIQDYFKFLETVVTISKPSDDKYASYYSGKFNSKNASQQFTNNLITISDDYKNFESDQVTINTIEAKSNDEQGKLFVKYEFNCEKSGVKYQSTNKPIVTIDGFQKLSAEVFKDLTKTFKLINKAGSDQEYSALVKKVTDKYTNEGKKADFEINSSDQSYFGFTSGQNSWTSLISKENETYKLATLKAWNLTNEGITLSSSNFDENTGIFNDKYQVIDLKIMGTKINNFKEESNKIAFNFTFKVQLTINNSSDENSNDTKLIEYEFTNSATN